MPAASLACCRVAPFSLLPLSLHPCPAAGRGAARTPFKSTSTRLGGGVGVMTRFPFSSSPAITVDTPGSLDDDDEDPSGVVLRAARPAGAAAAAVLAPAAVADTAAEAAARVASAMWGAGALKTEVPACK